MSVTLALSLSRGAVAVFETEIEVDSVAPAGRTLRRVQIDVQYQEEIVNEDKSKELLARSERVELVGESKIEIVLESVAGNTLALSLLQGDGAEALSHQVAVANRRAEYTITADDVKRLLAKELPAPIDSVPTITRSAQLVAIGNTKPNFAKSKLSVRAVREDELRDGGSFASFGFLLGQTTSIEVPATLVDGLRNVLWTSVHIGIDGRFTGAFRAATKTAGWVWWLSGDRQIIGFVSDDVSETNRQTIAIALPPLTDQGNGGSAEADCEVCSRGVPSDVTEAEVVNNPGIYTEDPGAFCKPFSNPERVLSEKSFAVVARIQQPEIGAMGSTRIRTQHLLDFDLSASTNRRSGGPTRVVALPSRDVLVEALLSTNRPIRYTEPADQVAEKKLLPSGRVVMDAKHPLQWEDDISQYQATTVALGHIIEFRVRSRSNGYSLGNVASTLTLAPRQTKRIQKIKFERFERARRQERTQLDDRVSDEVTRERDYQDTVSAYLDEWATGNSNSGSSAAAGGIGFAIPPFVGGVGGGASKAWSDSEQQGGRNTTASEQQRLRDSIRRHGDALRRFDSTVVSEVSQEETVTGTTEVVRNPNYGHSLTVIYYQILRHLKITTEFGGVRECFYVPFAIKAFTLQRAYRWRESIGKYIRMSRFSKAMKHLRDVATNFQFSDLAPGTRAQQPITYLQGSIFLTLAIARPTDTADGKFDGGKWQGLAPFLGTPAFGIWSDLFARAEALRDAIFQKDHAPFIATKWVNTLRVLAGNADLQADCTLATRYGFNQTVRIDFSIPPSRAMMLSRTLLSTMNVVAGAKLPAGSVANVTRMSIRYGTSSFERSIDGRSGVGDIIDTSNGMPDNGAQLNFPLDAWDNVDERQQLQHSVSELIEHLNEHVEFYHKAIWWSMDRDRLFMMLDGFYVPGTDKVSIASVVDREPVAIIGNCLVYRVGAASYIGYGKINTPATLYQLYAEKDPVSDPILLSMPTDGLYAQAIMDECLALEEHHGGVEWVLNDPDPELGTIDPSLLMSRRADLAASVTPTNLPGTIINLQNAPDAPAPSGLQGVLDAVTTANAFRDMAGLEGTQANARAALSSAANLALQFGTQAAQIRKAEIAAKVAKEKLAVIDKAEKNNGISPEAAQQNREKVLDQMNEEIGSQRSSSDEAELIDKVQESGVTYKRRSPDGDEVEVSPVDFSALAEQLTGDPDAIILARATTSWGEFGSALKMHADPDAIKILVRHLKRSSTFNKNAAELGRKYRSETNWFAKYPVSSSDPIHARFAADEAAMINGTYGRKRFLIILGGTDGGAFQSNYSMWGYGDAIFHANYNHSDVAARLVPEIVHEVSHALRAAKREEARKRGETQDEPKNLAEAVDKSVSEEIAVRKEEMKILKEIQAKSKVKYDLRAETRPGNVEREIAPGIGLTYLENIATGWWMDAAIKKDNLSWATIEQLRKAAESAFPNPPADQSDFSKEYFKRLQLKKSWEDFHALTPRAAADYLTKRNAKADEHVQNIVASAVMYRVFMP